MSKFHYIEGVLGDEGKRAPPLHRYNDKGAAGKVFADLDCTRNALLAKNRFDTVSSVQMGAQGTVSGRTDRCGKCYRTINENRDHRISRHWSTPGI
jgi:hypothetical protein